MYKNVLPCSAPQETSINRHPRISATGDIVPALADNQGITVVEKNINSLKVLYNWKIHVKGNYIIISKKHNKMFSAKALLLLTEAINSELSFLSEP